MRKRFLLLALALVVAAAGVVTACAKATPTPAPAPAAPAAAGTQKHTFKIYTPYPPDSAAYDSISRISQKVSQRTNGRITIQTFGPELADWVEAGEMVMRGDIQMELNAQPANYDPRWNLVYLPYLVGTYPDAKRVFGPGGFMDDMFRTWAEDTNKYWLGTWVQGFAGVSLSTRPATTPEEAKGIKIRVPPVAVFEAYWKALGFTPSLIPYAEVPTAISTGIVDGQAGGGPFQTWSCCRDLNKYFVWYHDYLETWGYTINLDVWNSIEAPDQRLIQEVVSEEVLLRVEGAEKEDRGYLKQLEEHGLQVVDIEDFPDKLARAKEAARGAWGGMDDIVGKVWMDRIRAKVAELGL